MKIILATAAIMAMFTHISNGQSEETEKRLNAIKFKPITSLSPTGSPGGFLDLTILKSNILVGSTKFTDNAYLTTNLHANEDLNIRLKFLNPLLHNISVKISEVDDPSNIAFNSFLKQMTGTFSNVAEISTFTLGPLGQNKRAVGITQKPSIILKDFLLEIGNPAYVKKSYYDEIVTKINTVESFLYDDIQDACSCSSKGNILAILSQSIIKLSKENSFEDLYTKTIDVNDNLNKEVNDCLKSIKPKIEELKKIIETAKTNVIGFPPTASSIAAYQATIDSYAKATSKWVDAYVEEDLELIEARVKIFGELVTSLKRFLDEKKGNPLYSKDFIPFGSQKLSPKKDIKASINVNKFEISDDLTLKSTDTLSISFLIIKKKPQVEVSTGIAWLPGEYAFNNYFANKSGTTYLLSNASSVKIALPTLYLNYYMQIRRLGFNLILPQIGVATGKEFPTILLGGGISEFNRLSLTSGIAFLVNQKLKSEFTEGMTLTDSSIINDVSKTYFHTINTSWYLSLNFRLTK